MRLGIFGGTFNPIHVAHLRCAEEVRERLELDRVVFIPTANPPHKRIRNLTPAADRLAMVRLAIARNPAFRASSIEINRPGRSYSVDTLRMLRKRARQGANFVFIVGLDAFREIGTWKEYASLFALTDFAVISRPPDSMPDPFRLVPVAVRREFCYSRSSSTLLHRSGNRVHFLKVTALDISASDIRQRVRRGRSIRYLVPPTVERYILRNAFYTARNRQG